MAATEKKIADLTALAVPADGDLLPLVDISDTSQSADGSTKKISRENFLGTLFSIAADTGDNINILPSEVFSIFGGTGIDSVASATRKITLNIDATVVTLTGEQTLTHKTLTTPKINEAVNITSSSTELNKLDGATVSTSELNQLTGNTFGGTDSGDVVTIDDEQTLSEKVIDDPELSGMTTFTPRPAPSGMVTFWFDDGPATDYSAIYPLFEAQGEVGALSLITDTVDTGASLTWAQAGTMQTSGWEITNHTKDHTNLTTLTEAQIRTELIDSQARFVANGITPTMLAYPNNASNFLVRKVAREYFRAARGTNGGTINDYTLDTFNLASVDVDDWDDLQTYKDFVLQAYRQNKWIIFYAHSGSYDAGDLSDLDELIDYAQSTGVEIVTPTTAMDLIENYIEAGDGFGASEKQVRLNAQTILPQFDDNGGAGTVVANTTVGANDTIELGTAGTAQVTFSQDLKMSLTLGSTFMFTASFSDASTDPYLFKDAGTGYYIRWRGSLNSFYFYQDVSHVATFNTTIADDTTVHVAFVMSTSGKLSCYIDGTLISEYATAFTVAPIFEELSNGLTTTSILIGNLRVWEGTALTQEEVWDEMYSEYCVNTTGLDKQFKGNHHLGTSASPTKFANVEQYDLLIR